MSTTKNFEKKQNAVGVKRKPGREEALVGQKQFFLLCKVFKFAEVVVVSFFLFFGSNPSCKFEIHLLVGPNKKNPLIGLLYSK